MRTVVVVQAHAALANVTAALALTHSSEAVTILMPGKFSVRSVKGLILPVDVDDNAPLDDDVGAAAAASWSVDDWAVPMTTPRAVSAPSSDMLLTNDWIWFRQEMIRRRRELKQVSDRQPRPPLWMSLGWFLSASAISLRSFEQIIKSMRRFCMYNSDWSCRSYIVAVFTRFGEFQMELFFTELQQDLSFYRIAARSFWDKKSIVTRLFGRFMELLKADLQKSVHDGHDDWS